MEPPKIDSPKQEDPINEEEEKNRKDLNNQAHDLFLWFNSSVKKSP